MKRKRAAAILAACAGLILLAGCGSEKQKTFEQAGTDLEQGNYEAALQGYESSVNNEVKLLQSYRGMGIAQLRLGNYDEAIEAFTKALGCERTAKNLEKDIYTYRITASLLAGYYEDAMADCQVLAQNYDMDADCYFLTGKAALALDAYDEAELNFKQAYGEDSTYERAIQIYEVYLEQDMEADGTRYLEAVLSQEPKGTQDLCDRGRIYYYMEDYANARTELTEAVNKGSSEAVLLLGMVYTAQEDYANARTMYQQFINQSMSEDGTKEGLSAAMGYNGLALLDIAEENYDSALQNIDTGISFAQGDELQSLLFNEIVVYEKKLDFATAQQKAQSYLESYPDDEEAARELAFLKSRTGTE